MKGDVSNGGIIIHTQVTGCFTVSYTHVKKGLLGSYLHLCDGCLREVNFITAAPKASNPVSKSEFVY